MQHAESMPFRTSDAAGQAPWCWGVFVPAVFVANLVEAIFAWFVVEWAMKQLKVGLPLASAAFS
jgi:hypothetical protein